MDVGTPSFSPFTHDLWASFITRALYCDPKDVLCQARDTEKLKKDVIEMREKMRTHLAKGNDELFDLKQDRGGITDIEFITQYLVLNNAMQHSELTTWSDNVRILTDAARLGCIKEQMQQELVAAYIAYRSRYHVMSLDQQGRCAPRAEFTQHIDYVSNGVAAGL